MDVFGFDDDGGNDVYINYMHVRRGAVTRSLTLQYKRRLEETPGQLLSYAMQEITDTFGVTYDEVVAHCEPDMEFPGVTMTVPQRGDRAKLLDVARRNARQRRADALKHLERTDPEKRAMKTLERIKADFRLSELPRHIECFDNSNIQGTNPVASCVVFRDAKPSKKDYRHFNIKTVVGPDDFASMKEVLTRRYTRLMQESPDDLPQLIVVDGGKGQLSSAVEALDEIGLRGKIALVGIAKRLEEIYFPGDSVPLYIDKNSESLNGGAASARRGAPLRHHASPRPPFKVGHSERAVENSRGWTGHRAGSAEPFQEREADFAGHGRCSGRSNRPRQSKGCARPLHHPMNSSF